MGHEDLFLINNAQPNAKKKEEEISVRSCF